LETAAKVMVRDKNQLAVVFGERFKAQ